MVDSGADVTTMSPNSWPISWTLQEVDNEFQRLGTLSQIKKNTRWFTCIELEGHAAKLKLKSLI